MAPLFPAFDTLQKTFGSGPTPSPSNSRTPLEARLDLYPAYSIADDAKSKAKKLSEEASREFNAASKKAQSKTGSIELYSGKYYAACTFGGLLACVSNMVGAIFGSAS